MDQLSMIQKIAVAAIPLLFAITVHEVAHGWVARRLGDPTAMMMGRLTLNPLKHIDPLGTILLPLFLFLTTGFVFGWAKPVPVTFENLRHPQRDTALVAAAGPVANLLMALFWGGVARIAVAFFNSAPWFAHPLFVMGQIGVLFNLILMVLNLIPVPPLDGSKVLSAFLPGPLAYKINRAETGGLIVLVLLMVSGLLGDLIWPPVQWLSHIILLIFGF